ncbi:MAG: HAMP domain-containing sensor histidine kinase [Cyanobacteriota/Melainabacteria group bacterium]
MKIVNRIRIRLALWFVAVVIIIYATGAFASLLVFQSGLTGSVDISLKDLISEIRPSVRVVDNRPTLKSWAETTSLRDSPLLTTVQLYGPSRRLLEKYGPDGVNELANGTLTGSRGEKPVNFRSMNIPVLFQEKSIGFLQIQVSTEVQDDAIRQFAMAELVIAPLLALGVGGAAYVFSGTVVAPIEKSNQLLRRFVADAGHELNTPVATIEGCLETLKEPSKLGDMSDEIFEMLERASDRLRHLAKDLIVLARVEDLESELSRTQINLRDLAESVVAELNSAASRRSISINMKEFPDVALVAHEESIHEILNNLIDNAIKYSENGGEIDISGRATDQSVSFTITDCGEGISKDELEHIFDRFYRVDKSRSRSIGGSGLGLSIVKAAVRRHRGQISVESEPGKGSSFTVTLPTG